MVNQLETDKLTGRVIIGKFTAFTPERERQQREIQKKIDIIAVQVKKDNKVDKVAIINKINVLTIQKSKCGEKNSIKCQTVEVKLEKAVAINKKVELTKKVEILNDRILRCNKTGKIITITVNKVKTPCNCTNTKITEWKTEIKVN